MPSDSECNKKNFLNIHFIFVGIVLLLMACMHEANLPISLLG